MRLIYLTLTAAVLAGLLAACGAATPATQAPTSLAPGTAAVSPTLVAQAPASSAPGIAAVSPTPVAQAAATSADPSSTPAATAGLTVTVGPPATVAFPTANPKPECVADPIPEDPNIPPVTAGDWSKGPADARIALIEYGDFQ